MMTRPPRSSSWRAALSLFTVIPAGAPAELEAGPAARAMFWLPAVGLLAGLVAAGGMAIAAAGRPSGPRQLLGAAVAVALLALLTGGLHLDGLADTADGLGSRRPAAEALAIMRRPDVGPLGVAGLVLVILIQVTALAAVPRGWPAVAALVLAAVTGRVAAVLATGLPAARPGGLGALVAGRTGRSARVLTGLILLAAVVPAGLALGGGPAALRGLAAALAGLLAGGLLAWAARRRLGGLTGDVLGAIIEVTTAAVLLALAVALGWT
ncbi:MAG TPA: adenosylcobinamide-GDP ribazoletransferase [Streptosporangiaceae bacterium]|nr:adenosylcobinamide-GDP ribazoletransferase [Streptosporangiaceae bacterium]